MSCIYLVCGNTICVSNCQVEFVLRELSFFILLRSRFIGCLGDFSLVQRTLLPFSYYPGGRYRKLARTTTTLAYRIVINCTTTESLLGLVLTFRLSCPSHRQSPLMQTKYIIDTSPCKLDFSFCLLTFSICSLVLSSSGSIRSSLIFLGIPSCQVSTQQYVIYVNNCYLKGTGHYWQ